MISIPTSRHSGEGRNPAGFFNVLSALSRVAGMHFPTGFRPSLKEGNLLLGKPSAKLTPPE